MSMRPRYAVAPVQRAREFRSCDVRCFYGCQGIDAGQPYDRLTLFADGARPCTLSVCRECSGWHSTDWADIVYVHADDIRKTCY